MHLILFRLYNHLRYACALCLFLFPFLLKTQLTQAQEINFSHLTDKDGLINSSVTCILKDSRGFMYFGTFTGLCRYDGYAFKQIIPDPVNPDLFKETYIKSIYESPDHKLYVALQYAGMCIFDLETESFRFFRHNPLDPATLASNNICTIYGDKAGNIWIGTDNGLDKFNQKDESFTHCLPHTNQLINNYVNSIKEDAKGNLWLYGLGNKVCEFEPKLNHFTYFQISETRGLNTSFDNGGQILLDRKGNLWVSNELDGLVKYRFSNGATEVFSEQNGRIKSNIITSIQEMNDGSVWIGTDGTGIYIYEEGKSELKRVLSNQNDNSSLSSGGVYCLYESDPGMIWVGTYTTGLNIYQRDRKKIKTISSKGEEGRRLNNKSVLSIEQAKNGVIYLGTDGGGLNRIDPLTNQITYLTRENSSISGNVIKSLAIDSNGFVWMGTYREGLCRFDPEKKASVVFKENAQNKIDAIEENSVWALHSGSHEKLWIGLLTKGVNCLDRKTSKFDPVFQRKDIQEKLTSTNVQSIYEDGRHRIWIATEIYGILCYQPTLNSYTWFDPKSCNLKSSDIQDIFEDSRGSLWFGTQKGGLSKLIDFDKKIFEVYTIEEGLPSNSIRKILEDKNGKLWVSTDKGIARFDVKKKQFTCFDVDDGLQSNEFNPGSGIATPEGYLFFGGIDGLNKIHPDSIRFNHAPPQVVITDFRLFNKSVRPGEKINGRKYLVSEIGKTKTIELTHLDYVFSIEFSALNFISPKANKYAYKLEGFSNHWTYVTSEKRIATYTNLNPGTYTFKVIASNNDGVWNKTGSSLTIIIKPPFWKTWWFKSGAILCMLILISCVFYYRERTVQQQNKFLEKEVVKRTVELVDRNNEILEKNSILEQNNREIIKQNEEIVLQQQEMLKQKDELMHSIKTKDKLFSIIGKDLRNPVNSLTELVADLKENATRFDNPMYNELMYHVDQSTSRIQNLIVNLLEWAKTQSSDIRVNSLKIFISKLIQENIELISQQAASKRITLHADIDPTAVVFADYNMISTVVRNILSNSIKFTREEGDITVSVKKLPEAMIISIKDNGVGMSEEIRKKLFRTDETFSMKGTKNEKGTGLGLLIANEFMVLNGGNITVESETGKGSVFHLYFKS